MNRTGLLCPATFLLLLLLMMMTLVIVAADAGHRTMSAKPDSGLVQFRSFFNDIFQAPASERSRAIGAFIGRTFGAKRVQFMLMPMVYKMGVMMTMLGFLTLISLKGLAVGVVLLVLKLSAIFGKLYAATHLSHSPPAPWTPPQPVHVHLHNDGYHAQQPAYSGWESPHGPPPDDPSYYYKG